MVEIRNENRKVTLLRAAYDLLKKCEGSEYSLDPLTTTVFYDEADCDGYCLMDDIKAELGIEEERWATAENAKNADSNHIQYTNGNPNHIYNTRYPNNYTPSRTYISNLFEEGYIDERLGILTGSVS